MQTLRLPTLLCTILIAAFPATQLFAAETSYFRDIRPIIQRQCQGCHQPSVKSSNLDLTTYEGFQSGGKRGPASKTVVAFLTGETKPQMPLGQQGRWSWSDL